MSFSILSNPSATSLTILVTFSVVTAIALTVWPKTFKRPIASLSPVLVFLGSACLVASGIISSFFSCTSFVDFLLLKASKIPVILRTIGFICMSSPFCLAYKGIGAMQIINVKKRKEIKLMY